MTRNPDDFEKPELIALFLAAVNKWGRALNITARVVCVARDYKEQIALYAQGREPLETVNQKRGWAGLSPLTSSEAGICGKFPMGLKVTWTLQSKHIVNLDDELRDNDKARAFDFGLFKDGQYLRGNDAIETAYYETAAAIADSIPGLYSGRNFKKRRDLPHVELA